MKLSSLIAAGRTLDHPAKCPFSLETAIKSCFTLNAPTRFRKTNPVSVQDAQNSLQMSANRMLWQLAESELKPFKSVGGLMVTSMFGQKIEDEDFRTLRTIATFIAAIVAAGGENA